MWPWPRTSTSGSTARTASEAAGPGLWTWEGLVTSCPPMFDFLRPVQRHFLRRRPFPPEWLGYLERRVPFFPKLEPALRQTFLDKLKLFVWQKEFIGAGGFTITDEVRVVVAATAVRLVLHL